MDGQDVKCMECGEIFTISNDDKKWYDEKGFQYPKRCKPCRRLRRANVIGKEGPNNG